MYDVYEAENEDDDSDEDELDKELKGGLGDLDADSIEDDDEFRQAELIDKNGDNQMASASQGLNHVHTGGATQSIMIPKENLHLITVIPQNVPEEAS